jgi:uncharacterized phage protein (TIGR01671 family)
MREIKFRGRCLETAEWVYGDLIQGECTYISSTENFYNAVVSISGRMSTRVNIVIPETVGQYTGLKDNNGVEELYQNDIVKSFHFKDASNKKHYLYHVVTWSYKYMCWFAVNLENYKNDIMSEDEHGNVMLWVLLKQPEYIGKCGNIHENPELINE